MSRVGLLFGSFNPIHFGHLAIAKYVLNHENLQEVWFVVSPHNPLKESSQLAPEYHRFRMVEIALENSEMPFWACSVEFEMPRPSFTIDTLQLLSYKYPANQFYPIIGADSLASIEKWKDYTQLLENYSLLVYPREGYNLNELVVKHGVHPVKAPLFNVSSTSIRNRIVSGERPEQLLPKGVLDYIMSFNLYNTPSE